MPSDSPSVTALEKVAPKPDPVVEQCVSGIPSPVRKRDFFRAWIALAFWPSWGKQDSIAGLVGLVFAIAPKFIPAWQSAMTDLTWQIPVTVLVTMFLARLLFSPYWLYRERDRQAVALEGTLLEIQQKPKLVGQIHCLFLQTSWNERGDTGRLRYDCFLIMQLTLNNSGHPTTVAGFDFELLWDEVRHSGIRIPLDKWRLQRQFPSPGKPFQDTTFEHVWLELKTFSPEVEITNTNHQTRYIGFYISGFPFEGADHDSFRDGVMMTLWARDRKNERHEIYTGSPSLLASCGTIQKAQERGFFRFSKGSDGPEFGVEDYWGEQKEGDESG